MERRSIGTRLAGAVRSRGAEELEGSRAERVLQQLEETRGALRASHAQLVEMERLAAGEELASDFADAINNPLAALLGRLQMRLEASSPPDPEDERLHALARRIAEVVEGMFQLARRQPLEPREISIAKIVEDTARPLRALAEARRVKLAISLDPELPDIFADPSLITQALSELVENALAASAEGGQVELGVEMLAGAAAVCFRVRDAGPGIAPELRERVFDPFFTTRRGSLGLGLTLAGRIARAHGGRLRIRCAGGGGCEATLELPLPASLRTSERQA